MLPWLKLIRLPNLPSAVANVLAAFLLVNQSWSAWPQLLLLIVASMSLYSAGMVLNDVFDVDRDQTEQPNRPIPSGQISLNAARKFGLMLLGLGVLAAIAAGAISGSTADILKCGVVASLLAACIWLYDGPLKRTPLAPWIMGACRSLNIMLGGATAGSIQVGGTIAGFPILLWTIALAIGVLVTGITLLARNESAQQQSQVRIIFSSLVIVAGLATLAVGPTLDQDNLLMSELVLKVYPFMITIVSVTIVRRLAMCVVQADSRSVKFAVITALRSLIIFDAAVCFLARPDQLIFALAVLALLVPVLVLSRWMYAT